MPMEIRLHVLDTRDPGFNDLIKDLDEILDYEPKSDFDFNRGDDIHDYLEDRFSNLPEINRGHYGRDLGSLSNVLTTIDGDLAHIEKAGVLSDLFNTSYIDRGTDYSKLVPDMQKLMVDLKTQSEPEFKHVILSWW